MKIFTNDSSDSNYNWKFTVLVVVFTKKKNEKYSKQTHKLLVSIVVLLCESHLFYDSCKYWVKETRKEQLSVYC